MIRDKNIEWQRKSRFISAQELAFTQTVPSGTDASGGVLTGLGAGAPDVAEVSTFGFGLPRVGAAGDTWAAIDLVTPREMDIEHEIGVRVHYMTLGTVATTDDITWIVLYDQVDVGEAVIAPATALDTAIAEHRQGVATALVTHRTGRGIIDANTFDKEAKRGMLTWSVEADAMDYSANEIALIGLEIDFMPNLTVRPGQKVGFLNRLLSGA